MASGYGLSRMIQGADEGLRKGMNRREQDKDFARRDVEFDQGQEDRDYQLDRREIEDTREDDQYRIKKKMQDRYSAGNEARREFMLYGKIDTVNDFMNKYSPTGLNHNIEKNKDGSYTGSVEYEGKTESKQITSDDIGKAIELYMISDPYAKLEERMKLGRESAAKGADRKHDIAKIDREWMHRTDVEKIKAGAKDKESAAGLSRQKHDLSWQKELDDLSTKDYGTLFGDQWKFDTTQEKTMKSAQADMAGVYYRLMDQPDSNAANRQALGKMREFKTIAENQADIDLDEGKIDKQQYDNRVADIIDNLVDQTITKLAPKPGEMMERTGQGETGSIPPSDIQMLRDNPTDKMKGFFDDEYGPGAADKALTEGGVTEPTAAPDEASTDFSLMRDANAAEVEPVEEKPKKKATQLSRKEARTGAMSRKKHGQIALSEYQNEWQNMDDAEKLEWWNDNSGALKARSARSHKKASAEIFEIRAKGRQGRNK